MAVALGDRSIERTPGASTDDPRAPATEPVDGRARLGRRTKDLVKQLEVGEIAVIDHANLDRIAAEDLAAARLGAVLNNSPSTTDHYPNIGPLLLARAGVPLVDIGPGVDLFDLLSDADRLTVEGNNVLRDGQLIATGHLHALAEVEARLKGQRAEIDRAIGEFATNTIEHVREESELLSGEIDFPPLQTDFWERQVLIIVRGSDYREDLAALAAYIRDVRPLIVAVDGAADAVMANGLKPDVILGDMDSATDKALGCGAELIVHAYHDGRAPGRERLEEIGEPYVLVPAAGTSQDVAMLLAHERGASLIVTVGAHFNLTEFLDKNRAGMSSTFLTRLRVGETLVDAKGVSRLYQPGLSRSGALAFAAAFMLLAVIVVLASPNLDNIFELLWIKIRDVTGL